MTRSASQRYIHRKTQRKRFAAHRKKSAPSPRRRRLIRQKGRVDDTLRARLRVLSTPHRWCLRFVRLPFPPHEYVPVVTSPSITSRFFDRRRGGRGSGIGAAEGFFATGRISSGRLRISDRISSEMRDGATGSPERYVDRHRFVTSLRVRSSQTRDFLSSGSFRPLLLFFPDDGERFPRRRVSRACPEDGTRGFEAPTRRKDRRRGEHRGARFFVVARASSPRERALTCVIGSDSEYAKRPREVPI